eukprot:g83283.t1
MLSRVSTNALRTSFANKLTPVAAATTSLLNAPVCPSCGKRGLHKHGNPPKDPQAALTYLREGNQRFVKGEILAPNRSLDVVKRTHAGQSPFAAFLSCADSRVPVEIIFDQGFGDVFITRVAGNIVTTEVIASLEFGTAVLGSKVLYVLGHTKCGAVAATAAGNPVPGVISSLYYSIKPACETAKNDVEEAIKVNVKNQARALAVSPVIAGLVKENKLTIVGGVYDLATGKVYLFQNEVNLLNNFLQAKVTDTSTEFPASIRNFTDRRNGHCECDAEILNINSISAASKWLQVL